MLKMQQITFMYIVYSNICRLKHVNNCLNSQFGLGVPVHLRINSV